MRPLTSFVLGAAAMTVCLTAMNYLSRQEIAPSVKVNYDIREVPKCDHPKGWRTKPLLVEGIDKIEVRCHYWKAA